jgi:hypothetical protein
VDVSTVTRGNWRRDAHALALKMDEELHFVRNLVDRSPSGTVDARDMALSVAGQQVGVVHPRQEQVASKIAVESIRLRQSRSYSISSDD